MTLRYVILHHMGIETPHFDALFETAEGSALSAWRLNRWPPVQGDTATPLPDHRRIYLTFEGPISDNRGHVRRVAGGMCIIEHLSDEQLVVRLDGKIHLLLPRRSPGPLQIKS